MTKEQIDKIIEDEIENKGDWLNSLRLGYHEDAMDTFYWSIDKFFDYDGDGVENFRNYLREFKALVEIIRSRSQELDSHNGYFGLLGVMHGHLTMAKRK